MLGLQVRHKAQRQSSKNDEENGQRGQTPTGNDVHYLSHSASPSASCRHGNYPSILHRLIKGISIGSRRRHLALRLLLFLLGLDYLIFYIRYFSMSRPSWLYGSPMDLKDVQACLLVTGESDRHRSSTSAVYWEWHHFHSNATTLSSSTSNQPLQSGKGELLSSFSPSPATATATAQKRLLIAQYSGYGKYSEMLDLVAPVNAAYARHWNHDFVLLQGTAMDFPNIMSSCPDETRSTFNKIPLLEHAMQQQQQQHQQHHAQDYDQVLILDTDAMMVDFSRDVTTLLPSTHLVAAHRVWSTLDWKNTWDINAGVTLWNLRHATLSRVVEEWRMAVDDHPALVLERNDDQYFLQRTLLELGYWTRAVWSLTHEFEYYEGTVIQHYKRDARSWSRTSLEQRLLRIQESIQTVCQRTPSTIPCQYPLTTKFADRTKPQGYVGR